MKLCSGLFLAFFLVAACMNDEGDVLDDLQTYSYDFNTSDHGWTHGFSDLPAGSADSTFYELKYAYTTQPESIAAGNNAIMLSGNNHSDDLFMYVKKKISGLRPSTMYTITYEVEFASDAKAGSVGAGGAPGESVFLKVGATHAEPKSVIEADWVIMNIDKGEQSQDGEDMITIGDIAVPASTDGFALATRTNGPYGYNSAYNKPLNVESNSQGELWFIVGTDSGYEGITTIYYTKITVVVSR
jgi:hypothetical protein